MTVFCPQRYEIRCQLLLTTNRKPHTDFRLVPTLMTLNGVIPLLRFSPNSIALLAKYVTVVEYRLIISVNIASQWPVPVFHFWP